MTFSLSVINLLQLFRETAYHTDAQPVEEIRKVRARGALSVQELLSPWSWDVSPCQCAGCVHQPRYSLNPKLLGFYVGFFMEA